MKKNYLFPHWFKVMGWVLSIAAVVAYLCIRDLDFKMPALSFDVLLLDDDDEGSYSFFRLANTNILVCALSSCPKPHLGNLHHCGTVYRGDFAYLWNHLYLCAVFGVFRIPHLVHHQVSD